MRHAGPATQRKEAARANAKGLPDRLRQGIETLSGLSFADIRVHHNSPEPAAIQAMAFARGRDIHLSPGQERHLPHEAWHVVQQAQGRVKPTGQLKGTDVNDNAALEREADVMGVRAMQADPGESSAGRAGGRAFDTPGPMGDQPLQAKWVIRNGKRVWIGDGDDIAEGDKAESPIKGVPIPDGAPWAAVGGSSAGEDLPISRLPPLAMASLIEQLGAKDSVSLSQTSKAVHGTMAHTAQDFMAPLYQTPETAVPALMPSVKDWAEGKGPPADPKAKSNLMYTMAGLDPATKLETGLGKGSTGGRSFLGGGGFIGEQHDPPQTPADAEAQYQASKAAYEKRQADHKPVGPNPPVLKAPKPARPSGRSMEYHPGGGIHSGRKSDKGVETFPPVQPSEAMGGSYVKVERPKSERKKNGGANYRFSRYGPFVSGSAMGYQWNPISKTEITERKNPTTREIAKLRREIEEKGGLLTVWEHHRGHDYGALSGAQLSELGSRLEHENHLDAAADCTREAQRRLKEGG